MRVSDGVIEPELQTAVLVEEAFLQCFAGAGLDRAVPAAGVLQQVFLRLAHPASFSAFFRDYL
jgi:hypothetical protein